MIPPNICPECKRPVKVSEAPFSTKKYPLYVVRCEHCGRYGSVSDEPEAAVADWNRRTGNDKPSQ